MIVSRPAVFLDRDGVINQEAGYVHKVDEFHFIDGVFAACRVLNEAGYRLIIITNQAGIARGYYTEDDFHRLTRWMLDQFRQHGVEVDGVYYCPHHPVHGVGEYLLDCDCRKPAPGMILRAAREHSLDLAHSVFVGDKISDIEAAKAAGIGCCVLVRSGHPPGRMGREKADAIFQDLTEVVKALADNRPGSSCGNPFENNTD